MSTDEAFEKERGASHGAPVVVRGMRGSRLTPAHVRKQDRSIVMENYESAVAVLKTANRDPGSVLPATLARAKKQYRLCRADLLRRQVPAEDLDYGLEGEL